LTNTPFQFEKLRRESIANKTAGTIGLKSSNPLLNAWAKVKNLQRPEEEVPIHRIKYFFKINKNGLTRYTF